jgi:hypothetical protein
MPAIVLWGFFGGFLGECLTLFDLRHQEIDALPGYLRSWFYWLAVFGMSMIAAGLVEAYDVSGITVKPLLALNIGASAPLILRQLARGVGEVSPGSTG